MWRPTMFVLSLIAALAGTPLREAEAANDFARSFGENGHGDAIETIDGGVGDDTEVTILKAAGNTQSLTAMNLLVMVDDQIMPSIAIISVSHTGGRRWSDPPGSLPACCGRRFAWLQRFLF
jgi:hypothetical protein